MGVGTDAAYGAGKTSLADIDTGAAKTAVTSVEDALVKAIATYNENATNKIDIEKFGTKITKGNDKANAALNGVTSNVDKIDFLKTLSEDDNIAEAMAGNTTIKSAVENYDKYVAAVKKIDNVNTALVSSATVGIDAAGDKVTTASGKAGISITANKEGIGGQISGLNISITDSKGNVKKSANAALDAFSETVRAQNESQDNAISLQVGASANQSIKVGLTDMRAEALGLKGADGTTLNISTQGKANAAINVLDNAIQKALDQQTTIGSVESRLEYTSSNLTTASENVQASESTIRDADMAKEMTNYTKNNVLLQAAQSMLAQANQSSSNVLSLLQ